MAVKLLEIRDEQVTDEGGMIGIRATAELRFDVGEDGLLQTISSGGLWQIDPGSDEEFLLATKLAERIELASMLADLGIDAGEANHDPDPDAEPTVAIVAGMIRVGVPGEDLYRWYPLEEDGGS